MIKPLIYAKENVKEEEFRLGKPTEDIEQIFSQISPIANSRDTIVYSKDDIKENNSFFEGSGQKGNLLFSDIKQETTTEETKNNENNSLNFKMHTEKDQDPILTDQLIRINTEKYAIINNKILKVELEEKIHKDPIDMDKKLQEKENNHNLIHEYSIPRRSTRLMKLDEQKSKKNGNAKLNINSNPKKEAIKESKAETKKESKRISASKVKPIRPSRNRSNKNQKRNKKEDKSNKKANNTKIKLDDYTDESSLEVISTNLDLNESFSNEPNNTRGKNSQNKIEKDSKISWKNSASNSDLTNLTKTFNNFIKFCKNKFDLLENKITNNKKATNPNSNNRNKSNRNAKKLSLSEKLELKNRILNLNREQLTGLSRLIKKHSNISNQSELEINLLKIPDKDLKEIKEYLDECLIKEKEEFMKNLNNFDKLTDNKSNEIKANKTNQDVISEDKTQENQQNPLLGRKRKNCILEDSQDLSESLSSSSSNSFSL